jgi:hypothetical protein
MRALFGSSAMLAVCLICAPVLGQGGGGAGGVVLDADKVLRWSDKAQGKQNAKLQRLRSAKGNNAESSEIAYVSLPELCKEAQKLIDAGAKLPPEMVNLGGITQLQYIFVYPETNDLMIAGPAEDPISDDPNRSIGASSGRPMLRLDDLAVSLRALGPGQSPKAFGCSIDMPPDGLSNMQAAAQRIGSVSGGNNSALAKAFTQAIGLQEVRFFGVPEDTNAAYVCIEADYVLKRLSKGKLKGPGVKPYLTLMKQGDGAYARWWFTPNYESVRTSEDGLAYELRSKGLKVECSSSMDRDNAAAGPGARKFAELVNANFEGLENAFASFADLSNICDLTVLAAIIRQDRLDVKTKGGMEWLMDPNGYKTIKRVTPKTVEPIAMHRVAGNKVVVDVGGVSIDADAIAKGRQQSGTFKNKIKRPAGSWMVREGKSP